MRSKALGLLVWAVLALPQGARAGEAWDEGYYNPQPVEGDVTLPMPCGGAMVFRRIDTPNSDGVLGDVSVVLGQEGDAQPFLNGLRRSHVSGPFSEEDAARSYFYMGKYEITEAQFAAVMDGDCSKTPRRRDFVPAVEHGKLDFDSFAERYTLWLMAQAPDALPSAGSTRAFLRLPTEEEWEYAARGGLAVPDSIFRAPLPAVPEGSSLAEYIAYGGADSAGGKVQIIGTLKPNALGLHDMLGNVAEIVETPFALVRHGRLHGQAGGHVKRGGDARTPIASITLATRYEVPPYDVISGKVSADRFSGARLVISALAITTPDQAEALNAALDALAKPDPGLKGTATEAEALDLLSAMSEAAADGREKSRIARIRAVIDAAQAERNTQRDRSIRLIMTSSVMVCDQAVQRFLNALAITMLLPDYDAMEKDAQAQGDVDLIAQVRAERDQAVAQLHGLQARMMGEVVDYADFVEGLAAEYSTELLDRQIAHLGPTVGARSPRRGSCLALLDTHIDARQAEGFADVEKITKDFQRLAEATADFQ